MSETSEGLAVIRTLFTTGLTNLHSTSIALGVTPERLEAWLAGVYPPTDEEAGEIEALLGRYEKAFRTANTITLRDNVVGVERIVAKDRVFEEIDVILDGNQFRRCTFKNVRLIYRGSDSFSLDHCIFDYVNWTFDGPAADTLKALDLLARGGSSRRPHHS